MALSYPFTYAPAAQPAPKQSLTDALRNCIMAHGNVQTVTKRSPIALDGDEGRFYIFSLTSNLMLHRQNGVLFGMRLPEAVLWSIVLEPDVCYWVRSTGVGEVVILSSDEIAQLLKHSAECRLYVLQSLLHSSDYLTNELEQYACNDLTGRVARLLIELQQTANSNSIEYSHSRLADLLNAQRESISMIIGRFRRKGWVTTSYGCIEILNSAELTHLAQMY